MKIFKNRLFFIIAVLPITAVACGGQRPKTDIGDSNESLTCKTIVVEEVWKHPKGVSDTDGLTYKIDFTYPSGHSDKAVLKRLQQQFIAHTLGTKYSSLAPEEAINACIADWKAAYNKETAHVDEFDFWLRWKMSAENAILFMNEELLQLETNSSLYDGGNYDSGGMSYHLFNLTTGDEYSRDDIFKPEAADNIRRLIIPELNQVWKAGNVSYDINKVWTPNTHFAVTQQGIRIFYLNFEICDAPFGTLPFTIPYNQIAPYLRENTPVWDFVSGMMDLAAWNNGNPTFDEVWEDYDLSSVHEELVFAKANGKTGVINHVSYEVVVPLIYDKLEHYFPVHDNHLIVVKDGKYGCIDFSGNTVLSLIYDKLRFNVEDIWDFCIADKWGLVEPGDKIIIPAEYDDISEFNQGLAPVKRSGKWGFVNRNNTLIVPFKYDKVSMSMFDTMYGEVAFVERDGEEFWIDENGNENRPDDNINI